MTRAVAIAHAAAVSAFGVGATGLGHALAEGAVLRGIPPEAPLANSRARKMMSRAAYLAARCLGDLVRELGWADGREQIGYFLGVGASGGSLDELMALLDESLVDGAFSLERFGTRGLAACNPLLAFQLMNNFTLCHGAILEGLGGPNSAVFSRGAGTVAALAEAVHAVRSGDCERAIAGGADAPTHPATIAELAREGLVARGLVAADAAALLALVPCPLPDHAATLVEGCAIASGRARSVIEAVDEAVDRTGIDRLAQVEVVVIAPWGPPASDALRSWVAARFPAATVVSTAALGESLAASAALAVIAGMDLIADPERSGHGGPRRALVLTLGVDGDPGAVVLSRGAA
ncbi:MAG: 3-oxoacyl-[acyl-carrier-protein] synthase [Myxococcales bacterium]|nr:3-oxoacyl-[acyl-carrier-protein] synthase [Myxococcales bacterium]